MESYMKWCVVSGRGDLSTTPQPHPYQGEIPMWIKKLLKFVTSRSSRRRPARRQLTASQLRVEALEDRWLPSFLGPVSYPVDSIPPAPPGPVTDFNGDRIRDIVSQPYGSVMVLLGNGDGTFRTGQTFPTTGLQAGFNGVGDLSGDEKLDFVVAGTNYDPEGYPTTYLDVYLGRGDGTFAYR